jgi:hypothetical protein
MLKLVIAAANVCLGTVAWAIAPAVLVRRVSVPLAVAAFLSIMPEAE